MANLEKQFYNNIGRGGTFHPSPLGGSVYDTTPGDLDDMFAQLENNNPKKIVLYFHGGLINTTKGMIIAERIKSHLFQPNNIHPATFVWETGLLDTIIQNLDTIYKTKLFKKLIEKAVKIGGNKLGIDINTGVGSRGVASLTDEEIRIEMSKELPFEDYQVNELNRSANLSSTITDTVLEMEVEEELEIEFEIDNDFRTALEEEKSSEELKFLEIEKLTTDTRLNSRGIIQWVKAVKIIAKIIIRIIKRHLHKRDHGFYPTIIEEVLREIYIADIGSWLWYKMKTKASNMWNKDESGISGLDQHAGSYFLNKLNTYKDSHPELVIDLIGHSAGSIAICHLIKRVAEDYPSLNIRNIIFMAPACRCELFHETIMKYKNSFKSLRIFTMGDDFEKKDRMIPVIYSRSLLYFISGVLEDKGNSYDAYILGLQRHIDGRPPYNNEALLNAVSKFLTHDPETMVYAVTSDNALEGFKSNAKKHTDFDNEGEITLESIVYFVNQ